MRRTRVNWLVSIVLYFTVLVVVVWAFFPFYWFITTSFKFPLDVMRATWLPFVDFRPTLNNWHSQILGRWPELSLGLKNSFAISAFAALFSLLLGAFAAYALARFKFTRWSNRNIMVFFLSQRMLPPVVLVIPFLIMMKTLGLTDTQIGLILINTAITMPFTVLILRDIFASIPRELEEAALVDGGSHLRILFQIVFPLASSGLVAAGILAFALTWNEYMFALTLARKSAVTIPLQILGTDSTQGIQYWDTSVRGLIAILPPAIVTLFVQRYIIKGLTLGAVKG
ncbi:MAG: carbohydrate ABC transporter permease [Atribacterota bacterium]